MNLLIKKLVDHFGDQVQAAKALGVSQPAVSQWLSGSTRISPKIATRAEKVTQGEFKAAELCPDLKDLTNSAA